jgi:hypothetical protein
MEPRLKALPISAWPLVNHVGDPGAHRFTAMTWHAVTDSGSSAHLPTLREALITDQDTAAHGFTGFAHPGAVWVSALQLAMFSLGWQSPAFGLNRWMNEGFPTEDPRLEVIAHLIGPDVAESTLNLLAFMYEKWGGRLSTTGPHCIPERDWQAAKTPDAVRTYVANWRHTGAGWPPLPFRGLDGDNDGAHINSHALTPVGWGDGPARAEVLRDDGRGRAVFIAEEYSMWYATLHEVAASLPPRPDGRSWRVDVIVKPIGWLGTFRLSRNTGRWFSGPHSLHVWGSFNG